MNFNLNKNTNTMLYYSDSTTEIYIDNISGRPVKRCYIDQIHPNWDDFIEMTKEYVLEKEDTGKVDLIKSIKLLRVKEEVHRTASNILQFDYQVNDGTKCSIFYTKDEFREWLEIKKFYLL